VVALSGYVEDGRGRMLAFSILVNESPGRPGVLKAVDAVGAALASSGVPAGSVVAASTGGPGVIRTASATAPGATPAEEAKRIATWYALATTGDARNQGILRAAYRGAGDPDSRLALAECVYLADPDSDSARRAFLDAVTADPEGVSRLWALVPELEGGPIVSSLADLAADGEGDALHRLLELSARDLEGGKLAAAAGDALAGVAATAPDDMLAALRAANAYTVDAMVGRLVAGMVRSDEKDHPFAAMIRGLAAKDDPAAPFAKALLARLEEARRADAARAAPIAAPR
jgi:D-alanyl-D-alanine carboxypeptidase/D-alanyl-D-alanine-endopeptidase (penicillin-binding protein 4)